MKTFYAVIALCLFGSAVAQVPANGHCPRVDGQKNLDHSRVLRHWYVPLRYFTLFELRGKCNEFELFPSTNRTIMGVKTFISGFTGKERVVAAPIYPDHKNPSKMTTKIPLTPLDKTSECWILGTDYDNYSVWYCCTQYETIHFKWAWIMTAERLPRKSVISEAYKVLDRNNIDTRLFWKADMTNCKPKS